MIKSQDVYKGKSFTYIDPMFHDSVHHSNFWCYLMWIWNFMNSYARKSSSRGSLKIWVFESYMTPRLLGWTIIGLNERFELGKQYEELSEVNYTQQWYINTPEKVVPWWNVVKSENMPNQGLHWGLGQPPNPRL